jgi:hypothetical protein
MKKVIAALVIVLAVLAVAVPMAAVLRPAKAASTVTVTLKVIPGIKYTYAPNGDSYNTSQGSLSLAGAKLFVQVEYTNGTVISSQMVTVNKSGYITVAVPSGTAVDILINVAGLGGVDIPVSAIYDATFTANTVSNVSVSMNVIPIKLVLSNGTPITVLMATAWTYNQTGAVVTDPAMVNNVTGVANEIVPYYLDKLFYNSPISPLWPNYLFGFMELGPSYYTTFSYWALGKNVTITAYGTKGETKSPTPAGGAIAFLNGTNYFLGFWVHSAGYVGYNTSLPEPTWYLLYTKADPANDTTYWLFVPVNASTGWALFVPWLNLSVSYGYRFAYLIATTVNQTPYTFVFHSLTGSGYIKATPMTFGTTGITSLPFNKSLTAVMTGSNAGAFNGTGKMVLELIGPPPFNYANISSTGVFYTNMTNGWAPIIPTANPWPFSYGKKIVINGKVYALAINSTSTGYLYPTGKFTASPTLYAYGTQIFYTPYKLSNSTSSTAYVVIKGKVTTLYGNYTVPNGTVEIVVNNGATNVYTVNVSVKSGAFSSPALSLSPTTNYTYKVYYYNASTEVLSSNASGTNVVFSGTPSGFSTLTVASTSTTTTTTTSPSTPTSVSINPFYVALGLIFLVIIIVAVVAATRGAKHAIEGSTRRYVKEDRGDYVTGS